MKNILKKPIVYFPLFFLVIFVLFWLNIFIQTIFIFNIVFFLVLFYFSWFQPDKTLEFWEKRWYSNLPFKKLGDFLERHKIIRQKITLYYLRFCSIIGVPLFIWLFIDFFV